MKRAATVLVVFLIAGSMLISCGGGGRSSSSVSGLKKRVFVTNTHSSVIDIVDAIKDQQSIFTVPQGGSFATLGSIPTLMALTQDKTLTLVFDSGENAIAVVDNKTESQKAKISLLGTSESFLISPDVKTAWVAEPTAVSSGQTVTGAVQVLDLTNLAVTATIPVPRAHWLALNHAGTKLLVFSDLSDSLSIIDVASQAITTVAGFDRPVAGFFTTDDSKAFILSCGVECLGSASPGANVRVLDMTTATPGASVAVPAASTGLMDGNTLYVAGTVPAQGATAALGQLSVIDLTAMTAAAPVTIGDGYHIPMSLTSDGKLYVGARGCSNDPNVANSGCLSIFDVASRAATVPTPNCNSASGVTLTCGDVTGIQPITGRTVIYVVQGGEVVIYDTTKSALASDQVDIVGRVGDAKLVD